MTDGDKTGEAATPPVITGAGGRGGPEALRTTGILLFTGVFWGLSFSLIKIVASYDIHPIAMTFWQTVFGAVILGSAVFLSGRRLPLDSAHLQFYAFCGLTGTCVPSILFFYAGGHLPAGVLSISVALAPMLTFAFANLFGLERLQAGRLIGVALGIAAVALIALPETSLPDRSAALWMLAAVGATTSYAVENVYIALRRPPVTDSMTLMFGMLMLTLLFMVPVTAISGHFYVPHWPPTVVETTLFAMSVINVTCYGLFVFLVTRAGPVFASQVAYVVTGSGVVWGMVIFGEAHSAWIWAALIFMMVGLTLVRPRSADRR